MTRPRLALSLQRALLGEVSPALRGVAAETRDNRVLVWFYIDGAISVQDRESASRVSSEVLADLPADMDISAQVERADAPGLLPEHDLWVYRRSEEALA